RLTQFCPIAVAGRGRDFLEGTLLISVPRRELHGEEREVALAPIVPPVADQVSKQLPVLPGAVGIGFALIPDGAFDGVGNQRRYHAVVKLGRFPRRPGTTARWLLAFLFQSFGFRFPFGQLVLIA